MDIQNKERNNFMLLSLQTKTFMQYIYLKNWKILFQKFLELMNHAETLNPIQCKIIL